MAAVRLSMDVVERVAQIPPVRPFLNHTQQILLDVVGAVRNLRDEDDVQCLVFLADEFAILLPNPFYFSLHGAADTPLPWSLVLRDTLRALLAIGLIGWENGGLRTYGDLVGTTPASGTINSRISWLATLSPRERRVLAQIALDLRDSGISLLSRDAEARFQQATIQALGAEAGDALVRRLSAVRWQLSST